MDLFLRILFCLLPVSPVFAAQPTLIPFAKDAFFLVRPNTPALPPTVDALTKNSNQNLAECRARVAQIVCLVDPPAFDLTRTCRPESPQYAKYFEAHFDRSPDFIQRMYCHLEKVFVEQEFFGTAYAMSIGPDPTSPMTSAAIGIRREVLDSNISLDHWLSWKEETSFGGSLDSDDPRLGILQYTTNQPTGETFQDYVLNHEFGHIFDFANHLSAKIDCRLEQDANGQWDWVGKCLFAPGTFAEISWEKMESPARAKDRFIHQEELCYYSCKNHLDPQIAAGIFSSFMGTRFSSLYGGNNYGDDWAEAFTQYIAFLRNGLEMKIEAQGQQFDLREHYLSPPLKIKRDYIENFLRNDPKYPGEI